MLAAKFEATLEFQFPRIAWEHDSMPQVPKNQGSSIASFLTARSLRPHQTDNTDRIC